MAERSVSPVSSGRERRSRSAFPRAVRTCRPNASRRCTRSLQISPAQTYVDEALSWLPEVSGVPAGTEQGHAHRLLLADDNADMREYARRLLAEHYDVEVVGDGEAALRAARARHPDIIVSDVMMPRLD